jgi:5-(aminomethyl)-3-furanmethanol phosphate kinase
MRDSGFSVVKLGGSHARSEHLAAWLDALAACGGHAVIVAGGGPFADAVRATQPIMRFDDRVAHHMALLAMEQYALALASLRPSFTLAASIAAIRRALRERRVPIWSPVAMVLRAREIPPSWDITSDSLAAWLAGRTGARQVLLVKHGAAQAGAVNVAELVARGVVDPAFPRFLAASGVAAALLAAAGHATARDVIRGATQLASRIDLDGHDTTDSGLVRWPRSKRLAGAGR